MNSIKWIHKNYSDNPANIRLDEDVLKTSWRRLSSSSSKDVFKTSSRRLGEDEYILINHTSSVDVFKTSSRRLGLRQDQYIRLVHTSSRRFEDVFKTPSRRLQNVFKTCRKYVFKHFQDVLKTYHQNKLFLLTSLWVVFNSF